MNSRRRIATPKLGKRYPIGSREYFGRAENGIKAITATHGQCRLSVRSGRAAIRLGCPLRRESYRGHHPRDGRQPRPAFPRQSPVRT